MLGGSDKPFCFPIPPMDLNDEGPAREPSLHLVLRKERQPRRPERERTYAMPCTRQRANAQASSAELNKIRAAFMQRASAPNMPPHAFKLAYLIAFKYMNRESRVAFVAQETLARDLSVSTRTVQRLLDILQRLGLCITTGSGRGKASTYWIDPTTEKATERATPVSSFQRPKRVTRATAKGRQTAPEKGDTGVAPTLLKRTKTPSGGVLTHAPLMAGESLALTRESIPSIGGAAAAAPDLVLPPADRPQIQTQTEPAAAKQTPEGEIADGVEIESARTIALNQENEWRTLRELWQRGWASDDMPKALAIGRQVFAKACQSADAGEIIDAARTWVAAADAPRFLPALTQWLAARGWEQPPPTKRKHASGSAKRAHVRGFRSNGYAKPDMFKIVLEAGGYREDADGNMIWPGDDAGGDDEPISTMMWGGGQ
jgi:helix-turn-helix protein